MRINVALKIRFSLKARTSDYLQKRQLSKTPQPFHFCVDAKTITFENNGAILCLNYHGTLYFTHV